MPWRLSASATKPEAFISSTKALKKAADPASPARLEFGQRTIGAVVDSVSDVMEIPSDAVRPAPEMNSAIDATYIRGLAQIGERMVILLDIESMLMSQDMGLID